MRGRGLRENTRLLAVVGTAAAANGYGTTASADTLEWALVLAYQNNPSLNAQRAALRAVDENVPQALSGYRPKLSVTAAGGFNYFRQLNKTVNQQSFPNTVIYSSIGQDLPTRQFGATATQTLFNGFQTANRTRQAESQVMGARETLRVTEQQVLLDAATAYMNLLRDQAILAGTVPIYQGGAEYSAIRQNKETLGQQRLNLDVNRDQARATAVQSWGQLDAAKAQIGATTAQVNAAEIALNGVREEARVGQRTTLDVLNAHQELVNARVALVTAQHDRVVASYTLLAAVGGLSMQRLGLNVMVYDPQVHYQQVRDAWIGVRTPDGR